MKPFHQATIFVTLLAIAFLDPGKHLLLQSANAKELRCTVSGHRCNLTAEAKDYSSCHGPDFFTNQQLINDFFNCEFDRDGYVFGGCHYCPETHDPPHGGSSMVGPCRPEDGLFSCGEGNNCAPRSAVNGIRFLIQPCRITDPNITLEFIHINCTDDELECKIHNRCVKRYEVGTYLGCDNELATRSIYLPCHNDTEFRCKKSGRCIPRSWVRDGSVDCSFNKRNIADTSDEDEPLTSCHDSTEFRCLASGRCIPREWVMNSIEECGDASDEHHPLTCDHKTEFQCTAGGRCLPRFRVNDGYADCSDDSDQNVTAFTCLDHEFACREPATERCIPRGWVGNGIRDCHVSGRDEITPLGDCLQDDEFACGDGSRCIPRKFTCDGVSNCPDGSDEGAEACDGFDRMFRCHGDGASIPWAYVCDGTNDCDDDSDEITATTPGFRCGVDGTQSRCLRPQFELHQTPLGEDLCPRNEHRCFDSNGDLTPNCSRCLDNKTIISADQICNGVVDCPDASDECPCLKTAARELCDVLLDRPRRTESLCNGVEELTGGLDERFCYQKPDDTAGDYRCNTTSDRLPGLPGLKVTQWATLCNGIVECPYRDDECGVNCGIDCDAVLTHNQTAERWCHVDTQFHQVPDRWLCDGIVNCDDGSDEENCAGATNGTERYFECTLHDRAAKGGFTLARQVKLSYSLVCDLNTDCVGATDELNCPAETHFYCDSQDGYISRTKVLDGRFDCLDNSDECPHISEESAGYRYASPHQLIKSVPLQVLIWLTGTIAIIGNLSVVIITARKLKALRSKKNSVPYCNRLLIFHLALADFLMGVSLYILAAKSRQYSGDYCRADPEWRSSAPCSLIGFLTVLSSQTSLNILVVLTGARLLVVVRRRHTQRVVSFRLCWMLIGAAWFLALLFAAVPLLYEPLRAAKLHIEKNRFLGGHRIEVFRQDLTRYRARTAAMLEGDNVLGDARRFPARHVTVNGAFGYYGSESVCLPDYYAERAPTSHYSFAVISYNFLALVFITVSYVVINMTSLPYRNGSLRRRSSVTLIREKATLRRRTALLVATNVACWLPVCLCSVLAFGGTAIPKALYPLTQVLLIPINSCVNPIIYSLLLQRFNKFVGRNKKKILRVFTRCTRARHLPDGVNQIATVVKETSCCDDDDDDDDYDAPITAETHL